MYLLVGMPYDDRILCAKVQSNDRHFLLRFVGIRGVAQVFCCSCRLRKEVGRCLVVVVGVLRVGKEVGSVMLVTT
jgi:hypothetical protein